MFKDWLKTTTAAASFAVMLAAGPALAQDAFTDWDADTSGTIERSEWDTRWNDAGVYGNLDANDDDLLDETELYDGIGDRTAFDERFGETAFDEWDADDDNMLSSDEFNEGVYTSYDADDSGVIEEPEFGDIGDDMGDGGLFDI